MTSEELSSLITQPLSSYLAENSSKYARDLLVRFCEVFAKYKRKITNLGTNHLI